MSAVRAWTRHVSCTDRCRPSFTGEAMLNHATLPAAMYGWPRRLIEQVLECACPRTTIYLPPDFDDEWLRWHFNLQLLPTAVSVRRAAISGCVAAIVP